MGQEAPQSNPKPAGRVPGGRPDDDDINGVELVIETQKANPDRAVIKEGRSHHQHGRDKAVDDAEHRAIDAEVDCFLPEQNDFHSLKAVH